MIGFRLHGLGLGYLLVLGPRFVPLAKRHFIFKGFLRYGLLQGRVLIGAEGLVQGLQAKAAHAEGSIKDLGST